MTKPDIDTLKSLAVFSRVTADYIIGLNDTRAVVINLQYPKDAELLSQALELLHNGLKE